MNEEKSECIPFFHLFFHFFHLFLKITRLVEKLGNEYWVYGWSIIWNLFLFA